MGEPEEEQAREVPRTPAGSQPDAPICPRIDFQSSGRIQKYLSAVAQLHVPGVRPLVSIILFGSAVNGAFATETSDVDLIVVVPDGSSPGDRSQLRHEMSALEIAHGLRRPARGPKRTLERFAERASGHGMSCFICCRGDLVSGDVSRVFGLSPVEAIFVDRIVLASVLVSAVTVWGEELVARVPMLPLRRLDVFKTLFNLAGVTLMCATAFPVLPDATKYATSVLKHSIHSCYFCYHLHTAPLNEEIDFFNSRLGQRKTFLDLMEQRQTHKRSLAFVLRCVPALFRLHLRTAWDNRFPRIVVRPGT